MKKAILEKIQNHQAKIAVLGLGYVGLPIAVAFAEVGFNVIGIDLDTTKIGMLENGNSYVKDISNQELKSVLDAKKFYPTSSPSEINGVDFIIICVPTPLRKTKDPDMSYIVQSIETIAEFYHNGLCIVLESTTYPGTTKELLLPRIENAGFEVGKDIFVAFSPERIDPGNSQYNFKNTPKVIGGVTSDCADIFKALYGSVINEVIMVSSPASAEMALQMR